MKKTYLISYKPEMYQALNSNGTTHILELKTLWLWGMFKTQSETRYTVPHHADYNSFINNWNDLIKNKKPLT